jgi:hypothetical protein
MLEDAWEIFDSWKLQIKLDIRLIVPRITCIKFDTASFNVPCTVWALEHISSYMYDFSLII